MTKASHNNTSSTVADDEYVDNSNPAENYPSEDEIDDAIGRETFRERRQDVVPRDPREALSDV